MGSLNQPSWDGRGDKADIPITRSIKYYQSQCFGKRLTESNLFGVWNQMRNLLFANRQIRYESMLRFNGDWTKRLRMMIVWISSRGWRDQLSNLQLLHITCTRQARHKGEGWNLPKLSFLTQKAVCGESRTPLIGGGENSVRNLPIPTDGRMEEWKNTTHPSILPIFQPQSVSRDFWNMPLKPPIFPIPFRCFLNSPFERVCRTIAELILRLCTITHPEPLLELHHFLAI